MFKSLGGLPLVVLFDRDSDTAIPYVRWADDQELSFYQVPPRGRLRDFFSASMPRKSNPKRLHLDSSLITSLSRRLQKNGCSHAMSQSTVVGDSSQPTLRVTACGRTAGRSRTMRYCMMSA